MCEFDVLLDEKTIFEHAIYAKVFENKLLLRDVLGSSLELENCSIVEVDVKNERLILSRT